MTDKPQTDKLKTDKPKTDKLMSPGQRAYEQKRAAKQGKSLEKHLTEKQKRTAAETTTPKPPKKPGIISRLLDRAHRPLKK